MKQIEVNPSNKPYYSEDFIKGFECGTKTQFEADKAVIDRIKEAREEVEKLRGCSCSCSDGIVDDVEDILDKLITEVEG